MSFAPRQYGHFKEDDLEDVEQEMIGKMVRTLRIKHAEEQDSEERGAADEGEYPMLTETFRRAMERQVLYLTPRTPRRSRNRGRTPLSRDGGASHDFETYFNQPQGGPDTPSKFASMPGGKGSEKTHLRPQSAPVRQRKIGTDSLRGGGVGFQTQPSPLVSSLMPSPAAFQSTPSNIDKEQEGRVQVAIEMLQSREPTQHKEGAKELASSTMTPQLASTIAHSGVLPTICEMMARAAEAGKEGQHMYRMLASLLFSAGAHKECQRKAAVALASVLSRDEDSSRRPDGVMERTHSRASRAESQCSVRGPQGEGAGAVQVPGKTQEMEMMASGKIKRDVTGLGSVKLPCHTMTEEESVGFVESGSMMWVYPRQGDTRGKPFQAFVQLLPSGQLFVGGVRQEVWLVGASKGCSRHVAEKWNLTRAQKMSTFQVHAEPLEGFRGLLSEEETVTIDMRPHSASDVIVWVRAVGHIVQRGVGSTEEGAVGIKKRRQISRVADGRLPQIVGRAHYEGERDAGGTPHGVGSAWWGEDGMQYMGSWRDGELDGLGLINLGDGERYVGQWVEGVARGFGVLYMHDGNKYEGGWSANAMDGSGMEYEQRSVVYAGGYRGGLRHGEGMRLAAVRGNEEPAVMMCEYSGGELMREWGLAGEKFEEKDVYRRASQSAKMSRDIAVDVARLLKQLQDSEGSLV